MHLSILTALLIMISASAYARLGETPKECARRYGDPVRTEAPAKDRLIHVYQKDEITVRAEFARYRAWIFFGRWGAEDMTFSRKSGPASRGAPLTDAEIQTLLAANAEGMEWRELDMTIEAARRTDVEQQSRILHDATVQTRWLRTDKAVAVYNRHSNELKIRSADATRGRGQGSEAGGLQGF